MTPAALVTSRLAALDQSLSQASELLDRFGQLQTPGSHLLKRVRGRFLNDLLPIRKSCAAVYQRAQSGSVGESDLAKLARLQNDALDILRECLAFLEGASTRGAGVDGGVCQLADSMLYTISDANDLGWERFTLVAVGEFFSTRSGIVRLRFTDTRIWNLPVAAHEFGHYVSQLPRLADFQAAAAAARREESRYESHLGELFSDLFATYALGPSYLLNCALLRFGLADAALESQTHPSSVQRVWWMAETLSRMDDSYKDLVAQVKQLWSAGLALANQPPASDQETARLRRWLIDLYDLLESKVPNAKYGKWFRAQELRQLFAARQAIALRADDAIPEILNAVWLYRLQTNAADPFEMSEIERTAMDLSTKIATRQV